MADWTADANMKGSVIDGVWCADRPTTMVVACSDGRLQASLDLFLDGELAIQNYDRYFVPGGAGALMPGGYEFMRAEQARKDLFFLIEKHGTGELILISHGAGPDGPAESSCAYYHRILPNPNLELLRDQQIEDIRAFRRSATRELSRVHVRAYRAEVNADLSVRYVEIT